MNQEKKSQPKGWFLLWESNKRFATLDRQGGAKLSARVR
jgi:hypothetical protein